MGTVLSCIVVCTTLSVSATNTVGVPLPKINRVIPKLKRMSQPTSARLRLLWSHGGDTVIGHDVHQRENNSKLKDARSQEGSFR